MDNKILEMIQNNPSLVVFLSLAVGYAFAKIKYKGFSLGNTTSVLIAAIVFGQVGIQVPDLLEAIAFALFIFCVGYKVGPQFFGSLKGEGIHYIILSLVVAFTALITALFLAKLFHFDQGTAAGFFAGSITISAAIGTAQGAIRNLFVSGAEKQILDSNLAVAYAITYIFGTIGGILFFKAAPRILGINLKEEAKKLEESMGGGNTPEDKPGFFSWTHQLSLRAYKIVRDTATCKSVTQLESLFTGRVSIENIKRGTEIISVTPEIIIRKDDIVVVAGSPRAIIVAPEILGDEIDATTVCDVVGEVMEVCLLNSSIIGKTLGHIAADPMSHGIFLRKITRQGHELPITRNTVLHKCDVLQLVGAKTDVERLVKTLGYPERPTAITDLVMVGTGCVLGTLIGLIVIPVAGIPLTLGVGGGVLVAGLVFGWLRSVHPTFGQVPSAGQWLLQDLGLNLFIACIGLSVGPKAIEAMQTTGLSIFFAGVILCLTPLILGLVFGKYVLKMNIVLLLGALTGARVITAALNTLQEDADSSTPILGYAAPYAFGNVFLTIWGSVIVNLL